jgi:DNA-binding NarL/FixJ family response regulator
MPGLDGLAATRAILARSPGAHICIVTDYGDQALRADAAAAGACEYVVKSNLLALRTVLEGAVVDRFVKGEERP